MYILKIAESIPSKGKQAKPICELLFMTLRSVDWAREHHKKVTFLLVQGMLDILIYGTFKD